MKTPLVSVKMLTYNHAPLIRQAIEGVLKQRTDFPFELVIGEDCSTDGTREIVKQYEKDHPQIIRVVTSDGNVGMKKNGLRTFRACRGRYVAYCEGDDLWHHPLKLQKQADYLEAHPQCGLVYSSYDVHHAGTGKHIEDFIASRKWEVPVHVGISEIAEGLSRILTCTVMMRRAVAERVIEADPYLHQSEHFLMGDTQLWAEISLQARLHYIPESLATHTITEESATRSRDLRKALRFSVSAAEVMLYLCKKHGLPARLRDRYEGHLQAASLRLAFHSRSGALADEVRSSKKKFTLQEQLLYFGAKSMMVHYPLRLAAVFQDLFKKKHSQWH